jgi:4-hydroxy-4-methyl-2-oxoglutarate aldolase
MRLHNSRMPPCVGIATALLALTWCNALVAQQRKPADAADLRAGKNFIATPVYTLEEDRTTLKLFDGLRVADVSDGMDQAGLRNTGLVSAEIGPLWRDAKEYKHRFIGIAVTARYVPTNRPPLAPAPSAEFDREVGAWYSKLSPEPFVPLLREGSALVIEDAENVDVEAARVRGCRHQRDRTRHR